MAQRMPDTLWTRNPAVLAKRPLEVLPGESMPAAEKANALTRLALYAGVGIGLLKGKLLLWLTAALAAALVVLFAYGPLAGGTDAFEDDLPSNMGPARRPSQGNCTMPLPNNPFSNALVTDFGDPAFAPACSVDTPGVAELQRQFFNRGLIRSVYDPWERQNSQRQWYTLPSPTNIPDLDSVRSWLYGPLATCKDGDVGGCKLRVAGPEADKLYCKTNPNVCTGFRFSEQRP